RPITGTSVNLAGRAICAIAEQANHGADSFGVAGRSDEPYAQSRTPARISEQLRGRAVLRHHQVKASVLIEIRHRRPSLFPVNQHTAFLPRHGFKLSLPIASQP